MRVLSLFDGISVGHKALKELEMPVSRYYSSETDPYALKISRLHHEQTHLGNVTKWREWVLGSDLDLIMGGSPCQGFSLAGKQLNFEDPRSKLFFEFADILKFFKPRYFLFENVKMKKEIQDTISEILGVEPIEINSALVSAQNRKRLFWTNIPNVTQPEDRRIFLKDVLEDGHVDREKSFCLDANYWKGGNLKCYFEKSRRQLVFHNTSHKIYRAPNNKSPSGRVYSPFGKSVCLQANGGGAGAKTGLYGIDEYHYRKLTPLECERLQTLPDNYTEAEGISNTQRYKMLGNAWTLEVIKHILKGLK